MKESKQKVDERAQKAAHACKQAELQHRSMQQKYNAAKKKFHDMKVKENSEKVMAKEKAKAMNIWKSLRKATRSSAQMKERQHEVAKTGKLHMQAQKKEIKKPTAASIMLKKDTKKDSAAALAQKILGKQAKPNPKKEKESKLAAKVKKKEKRVECKSHDLLWFANERRKKANAIPLPNSRSKELTTKANKAIAHCQYMARTAGQKDAHDSFKKWTDRVASAWAKKAVDDKAKAGSANLLQEESTMNMMASAVKAAEEESLK